MIVTKTLESKTAIDYQQILVSSPAFNQNGIIPSKYTCDDLNVNPQLNLEDIPNRTKSLAVIVDDQDASNGPWVHWVIWNIPVTNMIREDHNGGVQGLNDYKSHYYTGPCSPSNIHRYYFKVYALNCFLKIPDSSDITQLERAMKYNILGFGILTGRYVMKNLYCR